MTGTRDKTSKEIDLTNYKKFLYEIGYLVEEKEDFKIQTSGVDPRLDGIRTAISCPCNQRAICD
ncbi:MAG: hypothetical protein CM15mP62_25400 [Rhodospirillaceae bacterium]|nr:MAG: hypothetical protein CM15mP62_25400 [Rhodospirillaceae bacterium]